MIIANVTGNVFWTLREDTVIFGTTAHLVCKISPPCCESNRKWMKGNGGTFHLIAMNGASKNKTKYAESLSVGSRESVLAIKRFSENDVNAYYECWYEFRKHRAYLGMDEHNFEYHPEELLPIFPNVSGDQIQFTISFNKIYPSPICSAFIENINITTSLTVNTSLHGILYQSEISLNYTSNSPTQDVQNLDVKCVIGKTVLRLVRPQDKKHQGFPVIAVAIIIIGVLLLLIISGTCLFMLYRRRSTQMRNGTAATFHAVKTEEAT